jgi:hypothetical protein
MWKLKNVYKILAGKPECVGLLEDTSRWEDTTEALLTDRVRGCEYYYLAEDRDRWRALVNVGSFSRNATFHGVSYTESQNLRKNVLSKDRVYERQGFRST